MVQGARPFCGLPTSPPTNVIEKQFAHESLPLLNIPMTIIDGQSNAELANVNLKLTKRSLANENLPIWMMNGAIKTEDLLKGNRNDLIRNHEIMKLVGEFSTYQQFETSSSAVYFHERREFHGIIDTTISIRGLEVKYVNPEDMTRIKLNEHGITKNPYNVNHETGVTNNNLHDNAGVNSANNAMRTYNSHVYDAYPEILVVVTSNMMEQIIAGATCTNTDLHTSIVAYVLTLFNGIDMLFSKFNEPKIQINIAGIIIGKDKESFSFLDACLIDFTDVKGSITKKIDGKCAMSRMKKFLDGRSTLIPSESYDIMVILTGDNIVDMVDPTNKDMNKRYRQVKGLALLNKDLYGDRKKSRSSNIAAIVNARGYYESYSAVAHEIAHTLTVYHDEPPYLTDNKQCCGNLMKTDSTRCKKCLSWSKTSQETLKLFFSSPHCCSFINKPGSLFPSGQYQMLTADEQCKCYGYESTLKCKTTNDAFIDTVIPMYGTPCQDKKVCSENICQTIAALGNPNSKN
ncbi:hypothetical protein PV326_005640 [Microctonus aethiopoides]|nr:hypothetical protein PV326_005640 [Microctonus aethiopoides]